MGRLRAGFVSARAGLPQSRTGVSGASTRCGLRHRGVSPRGGRSAVEPGPGLPLSGSQGQRLAEYLGEGGEDLLVQVVGAAGDGVEHVPLGAFGAADDASWWT